MTIENKLPSLDDLPDFIPEKSTNWENLTKISMATTEPEVALPYIEPLTTMAETEKTEKKVEAPPPVVSSGKDELKDVPFTLGSYKNLARVTRFKIEGEERPLFGRAMFPYNPYKPRPETPGSRIPIAIPTMSVAGLTSVVDAIQKMDFNTDAGAREWAEQTDNANVLNPVQDAFIPAMNRPGSTWEQIPRHGEKMLVGALARQEKHENAELKDSSALLYALSALNLGAPFQAPMWHSGFWVSFRPASEEAWVNFNELLVSDKIRIGRNASGLAFSNVNAFFTERALEFALAHVLDHNIRMNANTTRRDLLNTLRAPDIPLFLWGFLVANNPSGYPISRGCSAAVGSCTKVIHDIINLRILQVTDTSCFEEKHRAHMSKNYLGGVTEKEVQEYQSSMLVIQDREFTIMEEGATTIKVTLKVPSAEEYLSSGRRWFNSIVEMVNNILAKDATDNQREKVYQSYAKAGLLREYSHWIKDIQINSNKIVDLSSLENVLKEVTPHSKLRETLYKKISEFIEATTVSVIAVPNYACPACGQIQKEEVKDSRFTDCIPLDVAQAFFNLALLRVAEIIRR